jgi:cellulose synthase/poly-beta-1,6-N-acetylglucosamine synthase-like glycosyltransferase
MAAVREVGLFDAESFFLHGDDVDLSWRMRLAGWQVVHAPTARVFHDKAIGTGGYIAAGPAELVHGPLGSLLLAWKYSRDDEVARLGALLATGTPEQRSAWAQFEDRRRTGRLPQVRLDPEGRVARFEQGNHALHRF